MKNNPDPQNQNGRLFMDFLQRNPSLTAVNSLDICEGLITRQRQLESRTERAVLDLFLVNDKLAPFLKQMIVDEKREYCLSNFDQIKKNQRVIEIDHNGLILDINIQFSQKKPERQEMFNLKNKEYKEAFTNETELNEELLKYFENNLPLEVQSKTKLKVFNSILHKCFRNIRICQKKKIIESSENNLIKERIKLKNEEKSDVITEQMKQKIKVRIKEIENEIGDKVGESYLKEILETIQGLGGDQTSLDGSGRKKLWSLLKRKFPKIQSAFPVGKKDRKGNLITNHLGLKQL